MHYRVKSYNTQSSIFYNFDFHFTRPLLTKEVGLQRSEDTKTLSLDGISNTKKDRFNDRIED